MPSKRGTRSRASGLRVLVGRNGKPLHPEVSSIAQQITRQALFYGETILGDSKRARSLFEHVVAEVSATVEAKRSGSSQFKDLRRYLLRTFVRRLSDEIRRRRGWKPLRSRTRVKPRVSVEMALILDDVSAGCDKVTQDVVLRRIDGFSWHEIGIHYGLSAQATRVRFKKAFQRAQKGLARGSV
jgi:DNA-directed RNA polymerase specialized sigma24 family protein